MKPTPPRKFLRKHLRLLLLGALALAVVLTKPSRTSASAKADPTATDRQIAQQDMIPGSALPSSALFMMPAVEMASRDQETRRGLDKFRSGGVLL